MSRLIPGALQHVSGAPGGPASGPATPTTNKPDDSRENPVLTRQSQPMGALVGGVVCTLDRLAGRDVCALHGHGINLEGVRIRHHLYGLEHREFFSLSVDGLNLHRHIAIGW